jgi:hypothetical protein
MDARSNEPTPAELASELGALGTGLGILSFTFFPFALPALVLTLVLVLPLIVLAVPALATWLLVRGVARLLGRRPAFPDESRRAEASGRSRPAPVHRDAMMRL